MICSVCRSSYEAFVCPVCLAKKSREAYLNQQRLFVPRVLSGRLELRLSRHRRSDAVRHIELFEEPTHAYCGEPLHTVVIREYEKYSDALRPKICEKCLAAFDAIADAKERV